MNGKIAFWISMNLLFHSIHSQFYLVDLVFGISSIKTKIFGFYAFSFPYEMIKTLSQIM